MASSVAVLPPAEAATTPTSASSATPSPIAFEGSPAGTLIIFDWDDSLLSSSWLAQNGLRLDSPSIPVAAAALLDDLAESVSQVLTQALSLGEVVIITNAEAGWVELSAKKFLPAVVPVLSKIKVISARTTFEAHYPDSPSDWKVQAFAAEISAAYAACPTGTLKNIISLGDSTHERLALMTVTRGLPSTVTKSVKFVERPTIEQLKRQVDLVVNCIEEIVTHKGSLDLMLTIQLLYHS